MGETNQSVLLPGAIVSVLPLSTFQLAGRFCQIHGPGIPARATLGFLSEEGEVCAAADKLAMASTTRKNARCLCSVSLIEINCALRRRMASVMPGTGNCAGVCGE